VHENNEIAAASRYPMLYNLQFLEKNDALFLAVSDACSEYIPGSML
jgi:hypothetical protein